MFPKAKRKVISLAVLLLLLAGGGANKALAKGPEDGLYIGGILPLFFTLDDLFDYSKQVNKLLKETEWNEIYFVFDGKMASLAELMETEKGESGFYSYDPDKLEPEYLRASDGTTLIIRDEEDDHSSAPKIEYIR